MFPIADQTAGPIGLNFLGHSWVAGGVFAKKIEIKNFYFPTFFFFNGQRRALHLVDYKSRVYCEDFFFPEKFQESFSNSPVIFENIFLDIFRKLKKKIIDLEEFIFFQPA